jgi:hypothetical protein
MHLRSYMHFPKRSNLFQSLESVRIFLQMLWILLPFLIASSIYFDIVIGVLNAQFVNVAASFYKKKTLYNRSQTRRKHNTHIHPTDQRL